MGELSDLWPRVIAHLDLDQFFAAVEILDFPELKGKCVIVGGSPGKRGVVSTASYEARAKGVHSAMPSYQAAKLCPGAEWRAPRMKRYVEKSKEVKAIFARYTDEIEPISLDEAFLEITGSQRLFGAPEKIGQVMKDEILQETGLVVSVGIAENKFLAKVASDLRKPDGFVVVERGQGAAFLASLPIKRLWGAGPKMCERLEKLGFRKVKELAAADERWLCRQLGEQSALHLLNLANGRDSRNVESSIRAKSIGRENTFAENIFDQKAMERELFSYAEEVASRLRARSLCCAGVTLKVRFGDFTTLTRVHRFSEPTDLAEHLRAATIELLHTKVDFKGRGVRLLGLTATNLKSGEQWTGTLFPDEKDLKRRRTAEVMDGIRKRFGSDALIKGRQLGDPEETTGSGGGKPE